MFLLRAVSGGSLSRLIASLRIIRVVISCTGRHFWIRKKRKPQLLCNLAKMNTVIVRDRNRNLTRGALFVSFPKYTGNYRTSKCRPRIAGLKYSKNNNKKKRASKRTVCSYDKTCSLPVKAFHVYRITSRTVCSLGYHFHLSPILFLNWMHRFSSWASDSAGKLLNFRIRICCSARFSWSSGMEKEEEV